MNGNNDTRVSQLRRSAGWTQERLSERSGVPVRTIQRLEAGHETSLETLSRVADAFKVHVSDLFVRAEGAGFAAAIDGLDERRARSRRRRFALTIVGWGLVAIGVLAGIGGVAANPGHLFTYAIGGLVAVTAGLWLVRALPRWVPMVAVWATAAVAAVYMLTPGWAWWVYGCAVVAVIAVGALSTWVLVAEREPSA